MLDPVSLSTLGQHFDRLMLAIQARLDAVSRIGSCAPTIVELSLVSLVDLGLFGTCPFALWSTIARSLDQR